jgi:hypothetical protein
MSLLSQANKSRFLRMRTLWTGFANIVIGLKVRKLLPAATLLISGMFVCEIREFQANYRFRDMGRIGTGSYAKPILCIEILENDVPLWPSLHKPPKKAVSSFLRSEYALEEPIFVVS